MSANEKMVTLPLRLVELACRPYFMSLDPRACRSVDAALAKEEICKILDQPAQQGQGEPVALPARKPWLGMLATADNLRGEGWNAYHDEVVKLGPLYCMPAQDDQIHEAFAEVKATADSLSCRVNDLTAQLAEAQALLNRLFVNLNGQYPSATIHRALAILNKGHGQSASADPSAPVEIDEPVQSKALKEEDVQWIVNSLAELGVLIEGQAFFLYKGCSLQYKEPINSDDDSPIYYRPVFKREFGECAHPINYSNPSLIGTVSLSDSESWKILPGVLERNPS